MKGSFQTSTSSHRCFPESYFLNLIIIPSTTTSPLCAFFVFVQFSFLQPHPHIGHVYEIYTYININFLDLFVAGRTRTWVVDQIQLTGCKGMLSWFVDMSNKFLFYIYICKFNLTWALRFHPLLAKNVYNLDLFLFFSFFVFWDRKSVV